MSDKENATIQDKASANGMVGVEQDRPNIEDLALAKQTIDELKAKIEEYQDIIKRKQAEFDNYRKRVLKEKEELVKYANQKLILDLLPVIDNFEKALKSAEVSKDFDSFHQGIELIEKNFKQVLEKYGVKPFESEGKSFDPLYHEAIAVEDEGDYNVDTVVEDYQRGYMYGDRVLRHAKVKVAKAKRKQGEGSNSDKADDNNKNNE